ncbi:MAG: caspase family protein, partial [Proteobacteria bacterium]|nr:caspase family protein [Pseudomonadota bacterium]
MRVTRAIYVLTLFLIAGLMMAVSPAEAKRANFYNNDQLTLLLSGGKAEAKAGSCSAGFDTATAILTFSFDSQKTFSVDYLCEGITGQADSETSTGKWWTEDDQFCMKFKSTIILAMLPSNAECFSIRFEEYQFVLYSSNNAVWKLSVSNPKFSSNKKLLAALGYLAGKTKTQTETETDALPPAEYKPLPEGTKVKYEGWSFIVVKSEGFTTTVKTASRKWFSYYGLFGKEGNQVYSRGGFTALTEYKEEAKSVLKSFWPLEVGKKAEINFDEGISHSISSADRGWRVTLEVVGTELLDLDGIRYPTYVVKVNTTGGVVDTYDFRFGDEEYLDTKWYHPDSGLILKSERKWIRGIQEGTSTEYALKRVTYPKGTTTLALKGTKILTGSEADKALVAEVERQKLKAKEAEKARLAELARLKQEAEVERKAREEKLARLRKETEKAQLAEIAKLKQEAEAKRKVREAEAEKARLAEIAKLKQEAENARKAEYDRIIREAEETRAADVAKLKQEAEKAAKAREAEMAQLKQEAEKADKARQVEIARLKKEAEEARKAGGGGVDKAREAEIVRLKEEAEKTAKARAVEMARLEKEVEQRHWDSVKDSPELASVQDYVKKYPSGRYAAEAKARVAVLQRLASASKIDFGNYHALIIGINEYKYLPKLEMATKDAEAVAKVLKDDYGFKVTLLIDPIRSDIIDAFDDFQDNLTEKDNLLIYYAGHGWLNEEVDRGYWLPVDAKPGRRSRWISNATITDTLKGLSAKHVMVVADSCYSGTLTRAVDMSSRKKGGDYWKEMASKWARVAITSGGLEPVADKGGGENSPFAKAFLDALGNNRSVMDGTT